MSQPTPAPSKPVILPPRVNSPLLAKFQKPGEPVIVVKIADLGMTSDFDMQVGNRSYLFRWDSRKGGHILRVPHGIWHQNKEQVANEIMYQRKMRYPVIVTVELPAVEALPISTTQGGEAASRQPHTLENEGSNPSPGTIVLPPSNEAPFADGADKVKKPKDEQTEGNKEPEPPKVLMYGEMPLHAAVAELVKESAIRVKAIAHQLDVPEDDIRAALKDPESTAEVANAGWVRIKGATSTEGGEE